MAETNLGRVAIVPRGTYSASVQYVYLDLVYYQGSSYLVHTQPTIGTLPTDTNYFYLAAEGAEVEMRYDSVTDYIQWKLITDATWNNLIQPADFTPTIVQTTGTSETDVMSQKAVTDELAAKQSKAITPIEGMTATTVEDGLGELKEENSHLKMGIAFQTDEFNSIGATITNDNKWFVNDKYVGALVSVADYKGNLIDICGNENMGSVYTFLKNGDIVNDQRPVYSDEYSKTIDIPANQIARIPIPFDAEYLYVYIRSQSIYYVPKYVRIYDYSAQINSIDEQRLLYEKKTDSINDLLEFTPVFLDISSVVQGSTMNTDGSDADDLLNTCRTDYIYLSGINMLSILGNKQLADGYVLWFKYTWYQSDYSFVSVSAWTTDASIKVPSNAMGGYVRIAIYRKNGSTILSNTAPADLIPYRLSVCSTINKITDFTASDSILKGLAPREIIVCSYNIGHFSLGSSQNSTITSANYLSKLNLFRPLIYDTINPKIIGLQEYSEVFGIDTDGVSKQAIDVLFDDLSVFYEGVQRRYSCNALYANTYIKNIQINEFQSIQNEEVTHTTAIETTDYYYLSADLYMEGRLVKIVSAHLVFDNNRPSVLQLLQINELIAKYAADKRVVMIGDWNVYAQADFDPFVAAGYTLANDGTIITYPSASKALDNIVVKGLTITNVQAIVSDLSDHYPLLATISL